MNLSKLYLLNNKLAPPGTPGAAGGSPPGAHGAGGSPPGAHGAGGGSPPGAGGGSPPGAAGGSPPGAHGAGGGSPPVTPPGGVHIVPVVVGAGAAIGSGTIKLFSKLNEHFNSVFFIIFLFLHLLDYFFLGFGRVLNQMFLLSILAIFGTIILTIFASDTGKRLEEAGIYLLFLLLMVWIPYILDILISHFPNLNFLLGIYLITPIFPLFLLFISEANWANVVKKIYLIAWIIFALFFVLTNTPNLSSRFVSGDAKTGVSTMWESIKDNFVSGKEKIINQITTAKKIANGTLDPTYYSGQVEDNANKRLGVRFDEVRPADSIFYTDDNPLIFGYISADSFLQDSIFVNPSCYIARKTGSYPEGNVDPIQAEVFVGQSTNFECKFPPLKKGTYPIGLGATFDFDTWADMTYTFVLESKAREYAKSRKDVRQELDIKQEPTAIFTDGPVKIGMGGSRMPLLVSDNPPYLKNAYLGITIESQWKGELNKVYSVDIKIPKELILSDCSRGNMDVSPDKNVPNYNDYTFKDVVNKNTPYTTIRCKLGVQDFSYFDDLKSVDKMERTFIATTHYRYTITSSTSITVK